MKSFKMVYFKTLILLLLLIPSVLIAQVATVVAIRPPVESVGRELQQGDTIEVGVSISTGKRAFAVLQFEDGAKVTIRPNSEMIITRYGNNAEISLVSGGLRIITGTIAKNDPADFKVRTPVALMGVRGTEFSVEYIKDD